jgi:hypothetical protein
MAADAPAGRLPWPGKRIPEAPKWPGDPKTAAPSMALPSGQLLRWIGRWDTQEKLKKSKYISEDHAKRHPGLALS